MGIPAEMNDFGRVAIVCRMEHENPHENIAWECFHYGRTLAILPMPGNASSIVITVPASAAPGILSMDEATFNADIEERFEFRLGRMTLVGERHAYPLVAVHAKQFIGQRFALIGDAAVGMHPVTAHGFNLGLSGAELLAGEVSKAAQKQADIGAPDVLLPYQAKHRLDTLPLFHGTNTVVGLFTNDSFPATLLRKAVLHASNHLPPVKWAIRRKLTGQAGLSALPSPPGWLLSRLPGFKAG
jgi:ubiquinone biosynthesis UbiH/UbiF/VisC/COQ6 family hydroxylase